MTESSNSIFIALRFIFGTIAVLLGVLLLTVFIAAFNASNTNEAGATGDISSTGMSDSPNVVTRGVAMVSSMLAGSTGPVEKVAAQAEHPSSEGKSTNAALHVVHDVSGGFAAVGRGVWGGVASAGRGVGGGTIFAGRAVGNSALFIIHAPNNIFQFATKSTASAAASLIRPADHDHSTVPIIEPDSPALLAAQKALPATPAATVTPVAAPAAAPSVPAPVANSVPVWPIHGAVTTRFGATGWPYSSPHAGIDISDGKASGVTPVHSFRTGKVVEVVRATRSLGNHIVVDHGSGVTSVYGHLATLAVSVGQNVSTDTVLGTEGSTGFSTGTHLHFEIRVNGAAADPHRFIAGQP